MSEQGHTDTFLAMETRHFVVVKNVSGYHLEVITHTPVPQISTLSFFCFSPFLNASLGSLGGWLGHDWRMVSTGGSCVGGARGAFMARHLVGPWIEAVGPHVLLRAGQPHATSVAAGRAAM